MMQASRRAEVVARAILVHWAVWRESVLPTEEEEGRAEEPSAQVVMRQCRIQRGAALPSELRAARAQGAGYRCPLCGWRHAAEAACPRARAEV